MSLIRDADSARHERRERIITETIERVNDAFLDISPEIAMAVCRRMWERSQARFVKNLHVSLQRRNDVEEEPGSAVGVASRTLSRIAEQR